MNTHTNPPAGPQDAPLCLPTDVTPEEVFQAIGRLRKEARDAIDELIRFLDKTDDYVSRELEDDGDQGDASYPEGRSRMFGHPGEDDEDTNDSEPSLGSSGHSAGGAIDYAVPTISDGFQTVYDCEADEHDGREPSEDNEPSLCGLEATTEGDGRDCEQDDSDREPSLGWTIDGAITNTSYNRCDAEIEAAAPRAVIARKAASRIQKCEIRLLDGTPATAERLRTMPSNVISVVL